eukprot:2249732-Rhodomonas_salina.2
MVCGSSLCYGSTGHRVWYHARWAIAVPDMAYGTKCDRLWQYQTSFMPSQFLSLLLPVMAYDLGYVRTRQHIWPRICQYQTVRMASDMAIPDSAYGLGNISTRQCKWYLFLLLLLLCLLLRLHLCARASGEGARGGGREEEREREGGRGKQRDGEKKRKKREGGRREGGRKAGRC